MPVPGPEASPSLVPGPLVLARLPFRICLCVDWPLELPPPISRLWRVVCSGSDQEHQRAGPKNFGQFRCHFLADGPTAMLKV